MAEYVVKKGDTLNKIAGQFGYRNYKEAGLTAKSGNPDLIRPGEVFNINPSATSPARENYTASLASTPSPTPTNGSTPPPSPTPTAAPDYLKSYRDYLSKYAGTLEETPDITAAKTSLGDIQTKQDEQNLAAREAYEDLIHASGGTKAGAQESASVDARNRAYIEALTGVAESGASRTLEALTGTQAAKRDYYKSLIDASKPIEVGDQTIDPTTGQVIYTKPQAGFELGPGQSRYDASGKVIASLPPLPKEAPKETEADRRRVLTSDVNEAVRQLGQIVKAKGFKGVSPDDYNEMRAYLQDTYGYEGVKELDTALAVLGLTVDYGK